MASTTSWALRLAARLRELRELEWPDERVTQAMLATAFSTEERLAAATISSWESQTNPKTPPVSRLNAYARFFCTTRSLQNRPHLLDPKTLDQDETARFLELQEELLGLLHGESDPPARRTLLQFDEGPVVIICPPVPDRERGPLADERDPNFTQLHQYADIDALLQVFGHIRARNPDMHVLHRLPSTVRSDELQNHLVVLGGVGWNKTTRRILEALKQLPIEQIEDPSLRTGDVFRLKKGADPEATTFFPRMDRDSEDEPEELVEDVALIARLPNPFNTNRTLTVFNGIHSRGVVGAVLTITDETVRRSNEHYLAQSYPTGGFAMLVKVLVLSGYALAPDLNNAELRIFEWAPGNG